MSEAQIPERFWVEARDIVFAKFYSIQMLGKPPLERAFAWPPDDLVKETALRLAAEAEVKRLRDALRDCQPILWHFAAMNPKFYSMGGSEQDPMGVHGLLPRIDAALATQQASAAKGE